MVYWAHQNRFPEIMRLERPINSNGVVEVYCIFEPNLPRNYQQKVFDKDSFGPDKIKNMKENTSFIRIERRKGAEEVEEPDKGKNQEKVTEHMHGLGHHFRVATDCYKKSDEECINI